MYAHASSGTQFRTALLYSSSTLMLLCAAPMAAWCVGYPANTSVAGAFVPSSHAAQIAAVVYGFSVVTALLGLSAGHGSLSLAWPRGLAWSQLAASALLVVVLHDRHLLVLAPLAVLTILLIYAMGPSGARRKSFSTPHSPRSADRTVEEQVTQR